ncbi:hypothetical protein AQUSIP_25850 [Aquicella siphonis]|uniref:N-acetyltransferase domain-containing protein n=1 Tax=Aquicella siphonis TaxID=254247 RepID=A0A5E4PL27_9COXI|nr:GNAT family N-acetyltransferase [Aquicella siphonis]VVC77258.1 hypothetical protein AQUSIP_25850 [Aquicella siphonis]
MTISIREPNRSDESAFLDAMHRSEKLHTPWVRAPLTSEEFRDYVNRYQQPNQKSYLVCGRDDQIMGVFNLSEIVRGLFQNAYLGFYAVADYAGKGHMSAGLKQVLEKTFGELGLHRLEANIQPDNSASVQLVKANGFRKEGYSPRYLKIGGQWRDHERWAMTIEDWMEMRNAHAE